MADNRRVKMTKTLMKTALLELLETKVLEKITVTDICQRADVNRSTFYAYYTDVGGLLLELEDDVLGQLPVSPELPVRPSASNERFLATLVEFFEYVRQNERMFRTLILQRDSNRFNQRLVNVVMEKYDRQPSGVDKLADRYAYVYCVNGVIGIMKEWIGGNFPISTREFAAMVLEMSAKAIS